MNKPIKKISAGNVQASIWQNQVQVNGALKDFFSVSVERSYKDKAGNWKNTSSLTVADIPKAQLVLAEAYRFLSLKGLMPTQEQVSPQTPVVQRQGQPATPQPSQAAGATSLQIHNPGIEPQYINAFDGVKIENVAC